MLSIENRRSTRDIIAPSKRKKREGRSELAADFRRVYRKSIIKIRKISSLLGDYQNPADIRLEAEIRP